ncbi:MAG: hypothetical protein V8R14_00900 [Clostridia bacterium]
MNERYRVVIKEKSEEEIESIRERHGGKHTLQPPKNESLQKKNSEKNTFSIPDTTSIISSSDRTTTMRML